MVNEPLSSLVVAFESSQTARSASRPDPSMLAEDKAYSYQNLNPAGFVDVLGELKPNIPFLDAGGKVNKGWRMWLRCVLAYIILVSDPYMNTALSSRGVGLERVLDDHPDMLKWVYQATVLDGDDRVIRLLKILRVDCPGPLIRCNDTSQALYVVDSSFKKGAVDSWRIPFRGRSARLLHAILMDHMKIDQLGRHDARYTTHIQSAGAGKSRSHDELAKHVLYIPLNLAPNDTTCQCYPPPDRNIGVWINKSCKIDDHYTRKRLQGFFYALFTVTERRLNDIQNDPQLNIPSRKIEDIDPDAVDADPPIGTTNRDRSILRATLFRLARLSRAFRERLASGCTFEAHGEYRWTFYEEVQVEADKFVLTCVLDRATSTETLVLHAAN
ncbi:hypothetical protein OF83DRAFT_1286464 [Amylostereum chailletii]|nr:hypothetical protein OF83DRAFT_1286464 [Amylostereum chailletii]